MGGGGGEWVPGLSVHDLLRCLAQKYQQSVKESI